MKSKRWANALASESLGKQNIQAKEVYRPIRLTQCCTQFKWLRFFVYCICTIMWHLNDVEIPQAKRFIPKGFELGTTLS